MHRNEMKEISN